MSPEREKVAVRVGTRELTLSNLGKVLYPDTGFAKGQVIDYYTRIAPVLLPHLKNRPLTFKRYPDGVDGKFFFEKNAPRHKPPWVKTATLPSPGSTKNRTEITYALANDLPTLVWAANLATLEMHVPMWRVDGKGKPKKPDTMVYDLDPGPPATIVECCEVALLVREVLAADGLDAYPKTSGSKGMQLYVPLSGRNPWEDVHAYSRDVAEKLESEHPDLVVSNMKKDLRGGKVLVDWSQNNAAKTTIAPYSLRARPRPTVSTPIGWDEVESCTGPEDLVFVAEEVLDRVADYGDLFEAVGKGGQSLPA